MAQLLKPVSFLDFYEEEIGPRLKSIDLILKLNDNNISYESAALLFGTDAEKIKSALCSENINSITAKTIIPVMLKVDSFICRLIKRELEYGCPYFYSPEAVSYIYNLDKKNVKDAFAFLELKTASENQLPAVFAQIFVDKESIF